MDDTRDKDRRPRKPGGDKPFRSGKPAGPRGGDRPLSKPRRPDAKPAGAKSAGDGDVREGERIAKVIARAGLCSRRDAEAWINAGRVEVNGEKLSSPAFNVGPDDIVKVDGQPLGDRERTRLWMFHKPRGLVTTSHDPEGRQTIFEALPQDLPRVVTIGRLDINTEGLLLLTNDGGLSRVLELPATGWLRRYRVRANGETDQSVLDTLREGVTIDGVEYAGIEATLDRAQGANVWITMGLREGKNREVKRVLEHIGLVVNRLIRISFGPFQLGDLAEGEVEEVRTRILKDQLGPVLSAEAGVDFEGPVTAAIVTREVAHERRETRRQERLAEDAEPPARRPERPAPGQRKHVSTLRGARARDLSEGPRKRIERGETADRRGRTVPVERVVPTERKTERGEGSRNSRRFSEERGERPVRAPRASAGGRPPARDDRGSRDERPARDDRAARPRFERPERTGGDRPPRSDAPRFDRGAKPDFRPRPPRDDSRPQRDERPSRARSDRPERGPESAPRAPRSEFKGGRPDFKGPRSDGPRGEVRARPPRDDKPRDDRGGKPRFERPERAGGGERGAQKQWRGPPREGAGGGEGRPRAEGYKGGAGKFAGKPGGKPSGKPDGRSGPRKPGGSGAPRSGPPRSGPPRSGPPTGGAGRGGPRGRDR